MTQVGGYYFQSLNERQPTAILLGVSGPMKGQQFIEKEIVHVGASPENDLSIAEDEYLSGNHAYLLYKQGSLIIFDNGSTNGTFVNEQKVTASGVTEFRRPDPAWNVRVRACPSAELTRQGSTPCRLRLFVGLEEDTQPPYKFRQHHMSKGSHVFRSAGPPGRHGIHWFKVLINQVNEGKAQLKILQSEIDIQQ